MKKDVFIKLIKELNDKAFNDMINLVILPDELEKIINLTDKEVEDILNTSCPQLKATKLYLYLKQENLSDEVKKILEKNVKTDNNNIYYTLGVIEKFNYLNREDIIDFIKVLELSDKDYQAKYASIVASDDNVLKRSDAIEFVKLVANSKWYYQAEYASQIATNEEILKLDNALEFVKKITKSQSIYSAKYASKVIVDNNLLKKDDAIDFIEIITASKNHYQALAASELSVRPSILERDDAKEIIQLVATSKEKYQTECAYDLLKNKKALTCDNLLHHIRLITTAQDEKKAQKIKIDILCSTNNNHLIDDPLNDNTSIEEKSIKDFLTNSDFDNLIETLELYSEEDITPSTKLKVKIKNNRK